MNSLVEKSVDSKQLSALGRGEASPVADNTTSEGRAQNRRIEAELTRN
jgi:OOP family OmpA-OmpF porin